MSQIFDALQQSEAERSGNHAKRTATELLQAREHVADAENQPTSDTATHLWPLAEPDGLQRLQSARGQDGAICEPHTLETNDEEREELMKFAQQVFLLPGAKAPRTVVLTSTEPGNGSSWIACR